MAINFPDSPSVNDTVTQGDHTWIWDGTTWNLTVATALAPAGSDTQVQYNSSGSFAGSANLTFDGSAAVVKGTVTVGVDDTGHDVKFYGATSGKYMLWDESADSLIVNGPIFAAAKMQTGQTSWTQEPWSNQTIAIGDLGSVGTQGSYRLSLAWNYERGTDSNFHHLDVNSYPQAAGIELGHTGILFQTHDDYENNHTTYPTTRMIVTPDGDVGIGTTTPMRELDVWSEIMAHHGDDAWLWQAIEDSGLRLWFQDSYTSGDSGWTQYLNIDTSGRLTQPKIPAFRVANTTGSGGYIYNGSVDGAGTIIFGSDSGYGLYDNGNNYNTSTGIFTAPVDGYYFFTSTIFMHTSYDNDTDGYWGFTSSNGQVATNHGTKGEDGGQTVSGIFYLDAGDTAKMYVFTSHDLYTWRTEQYNSFQGILIG